MSQAAANRQVYAEHKARMQQRVQATAGKAFENQLVKLRALLQRLRRAAPGEKQALYDEFMDFQIVKLAANTPRTAAGKRKAQQLALPLEQVDRLVDDAKALRVAEPPRSAPRQPEPKTYNLRPMIKKKRAETVPRSEYAKGFRG